jgi:dienelactone hydrolase
MGAARRHAPALRHRGGRAAKVLLAAALLLLLAHAGAPAETVSFPGGEGTIIRGIFERPARDGRVPALVLMHGCSGLRTGTGTVIGLYAAWASRLRDWGYATLLVDGFPPRGIPEICTGTHAMPTLESRAEDARGAHAWLAARPDIEGSRIGLIGWSSGGRAVLRVLAAGQAKRSPFPAAIALYPPCAARTPGRQPFVPTAPLLIMIGEADDWTPAAHCVRLVEAARPLTPEGGIELQTFPDAHHAFDAPGRVVRHRPEVRNPNAAGGRGATIASHPAARAAAFEAAKDFLARHLAAAN